MANSLTMEICLIGAPRRFPPQVVLQKSQRQSKTCDQLQGPGEKKASLLLLLCPCLVLGAGPLYLSLPLAYGHQCSRSDLPFDITCGDLGSSHWGQRAFPAAAASPVHTHKLRVDKLLQIHQSDAKANMHPPTDTWRIHLTRQHHTCTRLTQHHRNSKNGH